MVSPGDHVDRYRIDALIGQGGMGRVFRAFDERLERAVALKVLESDDALAAERFVREARMAAQLHHPNAVTIHDVGEQGDVRYIAMELLGGSTLRGLATNDVPWEVRLGWLIDTARALSAAHALGLVHRDVKPDNVMVTTEGHVKVLDFGIARRLAITGKDGVEVPVTLTAEGTIVGTPMYMAPEQLRGEPVDGRADQYAWGVMAYEVLSGEMPWGPITSAIAMVAIMASRPPRPLQNVAPSLPQDVAAAVVRAMEREAPLRYSTMDALIAVLEPFAPGKTRPSPKAASAPHAVRTIESVPTVRATAADSVPAAPTLPSGEKPAVAVVRMAKSPTRFRLSVIAGAMIVAGAIAFGVRSWPAGPAPVPSASATRPAAPVSTVPDAARAYEDATRVWWSSSRKAGEQGWERALTLDAGLAAASLRLALSRFDTTVGERQAEWPVARELFQRAIDHRASLEPRDAALLDAVAPLFERRGEGVPKAREGLAVLCARFPRDAELAYWRAMVSDDVTESIASLDHALTIDEAFGEAYRLKIALLANKDDRAGADAVANACVAKLPRASFCEEHLVHRALEGSDCSAAEAAARRWLSSSPQLDGPYDALAQALYAQGAAREAVSEANRQAIERMSKADRDTWARRREADLAVAYGDFEASLATWKKWDEENPGVADTGTRAESAWGQVEALDELGRGPEADRLAGDFARRAAVLSDLRSTRNDLLIAIFSRAWRAGLVTEAEYRKRRDTPPLSRMVQMQPELWWVQRFGSVWSKAEADEALREAKSIPAPGDTGEESTWALVFATSGDAKRAIPYLRVGAARCDRLRLAWDYVQQSKLLGTLLEAQGDAAGAREAYERVIATWGTAKKSVTVEDVRKRLARLPKAK